MKTDKIRKSGIILEALPAGKFRVELEDGKKILAYLAGKLRVYRIKILPGDSVTVEVTPYDEGKGRIVYRKR